MSSAVSVPASTSITSVMPSDLGPSRWTGYSMSAWNVMGTTIRITISSRSFQLSTERGGIPSRELVVGTAVVPIQLRSTAGSVSSTDCMKRRRPSR